MLEPRAKQTALDFIAYADASPTAAHAAAEAARRLQDAGFARLDEAAAWTLGPGDRIIVLRNESSLIALEIGEVPPAEAGFRIAGAHTDIPGLRLKPGGVYAKEGYLQLGVEVYGGPILSTWLDRDLGLAGRLAVEVDGALRTRLFDLRRPLCSIPSLAPHIVPDKQKGLEFNKQEHLPPLLALDGGRPISPAILIEPAAEAAGADPATVRAAVMEPYVLGGGSLGGLDGDLLYSRGIDNLASCHAGLLGLLEASAAGIARHSRVLALFDNEEVGSTTMQGAASGFLDAVLERAAGGREDFHRALARSLFLSVDGAHAVHPSHFKAHEPQHLPRLNGGPVIKTNALERYTSNLEALAHLRACAGRAGVPLQDFVARTDVGTGSTIGPMTASRLGLRAVDLGLAMLAMHSTRETAGARDPRRLADLLQEHFA